jgi:ketosteroid isomerase-like protein
VASSEERERLTEPWFHPDVEYVEDPSWPGSTSFRGRDKVRQTFERYGELLSLATLTVEEVQEGSEGFFALVRYVGASTGIDEAKRDAGIS